MRPESGSEPQVGRSVGRSAAQLGQDSTPGAIRHQQTSCAGVQPVTLHFLGSIIDCGLSRSGLMVISPETEGSFISVLPAERRRFSSLPPAPGRDYKTPDVSLGLNNTTAVNQEGKLDLSAF